MILVLDLFLPVAVYRGVALGLGVLSPWKYVGGVRVCFDPAKYHTRSFETCWKTLQVSQHEG